MNSYIYHKIRQFHDSYINRTFDQDSIFSFIVLVRDYTQKKSIIRELGDFLAHPIYKDRGLVLTNFSSTISLFENKTLNFFRKDITEMPSYNSMGNTVLFAKELNCVFNIADLSIDTNNRDDLSLRDFIFCIIFLLSSFKLKINEKLHSLNVEYSHTLELNIEYESVSCPRHFVKLNVLQLGNVWMKNNQNYTKKLFNHIARRFDEGFLAAISYDSDKNNFNLKNFSTGEYWPLPDYD